MDVVQPEYSLDRSPEGPPRHLDAPLLEVDLASAANDLRGAEAWRTLGHDAKTLLKYPNLRVVLVAIRAGFRMGEHRARGQFTLQVLEGEVTFLLGSQSVRLGAGQLLALEESRLHDVEAVKDSLVLLTLTWPPRDTP
jgi:quercetin dioxygenase-like cupin family protein